mgnify:CR=1 FL=1
MKEFEKEGLKSQVIVKEAGEQMDIGVANVDSEYRVGYELTKELMERRDRSDGNCRSQRYDCAWNTGCFV